MAAAAARRWPGITALGRGPPAPPGTPCFPVTFLATVRPDGSPQAAPVLPGSGRRQAPGGHPPLLA